MRTWKMFAVLALCLLMLASCGPKSTLITTPAKDMNLKAEQVGTGYALSEEQGLEEFASSLDITNMEDATDASYRMFQNESGGVVLSLVITLKKTATADDLKQLAGGFEEGFTGSMPGTTLEAYNPPSIGDEATGSKAEFPDLGMSMYFLSFRKANVIGVLAVVGTTDFASEAIINGLGQTLGGQIK